VIQGKRTLSLETGEKVAAALKLTGDSKKYFLALIGSEAAANEEQSRQAEKELHRAVKGLKTRFVEKNDVGLFADWHFLAVRELALLKDFEPTGDYVSAKLSGLVSIAQAEKILSYLIEHKFLVHDGARYQPKDPVLDVDNELFLHETMQEFHSKVLTLWAKNLPRLGNKKQELGLLNIPVPKEKIPELRQRIRQFQDEIIGWSQNFSENDTLVQLGTYLMVFEEKESEKK
jgi:uncharacterized protein (TIGR02147 family)